MLIHVVLYTKTDGLTEGNHKLPGEILINHEEALAVTII
jgi:hypothetical protein